MFANLTRQIVSDRSRGGISVAVIKGRWRGGGVDSSPVKAPTRLYVCSSSRGCRDCEGRGGMSVDILTL